MVTSNTNKITTSTVQSANGIEITPFKDHLSSIYGIQFAPTGNSNLIIANDRIVFPTNNNVINTSMIATGNSSYMNSSQITTPLLTMHGVPFSGLRGSIIDVQFFTTTGTWIRPANYTGSEMVLIHAIGAGGDPIAIEDSIYTDLSPDPGYFTYYIHACGGGGGGSWFYFLPIYFFGPTVDVTVGTSGGYSSFGGYYAPGGSPGNDSRGGSGAYGYPTAGDQSSVFSGGDGATYIEVTNSNIPPTNGFWGGGGGAIYYNGLPVVGGLATSNMLGAIGAGGYILSAGGGVNHVLYTFVFGARGEVRVWVIR